MLAREQDRRMSEPEGVPQASRNERRAEDLQGASEASRECRWLTG
jgi:hypothetical protein